LRNRYFARQTRWVAAIVAALAIASGGFAQETIEQRLDRLEKANAELQQKLNQMQNAAPAQAPGLSYEANTVAAQGMPAAPAIGPAKSDAAAPKSDYVEVGSNLNMSASWKDGILFSTPNKDFVAHLGGWSQYDNYWFSQSSGLVAPAGGPIAKGKVGPATGGIGNYQDGDYFRRIRLQFDGTFAEVFEWNWVYAFENDEFSTVGLDEFWVGMTKLPVLGNIRAGHIKICEGLEGDSYSSSRSMTFLEKSTLTEAFYQNFGTGLWMFNDFHNRIFWAAEAYRQEDGSSGTNFGDGEYAYGGRLAMLPYYDNDGRCLVHLGASYFWRKAQNSNGNAPFTDTTPSLRFRARPELRDNNPGGNAANSQIVPGADTNRMVDTGAIPAAAASVFGFEALTILGPFSVQAEWAVASMLDCNNSFAAGGAATNGVNFTGQDFTFQGGYVTLSYFLTGENRGYDTRLGRMASNYIQGGPRTPFWLVRGADGGLDRGLGAWELAVRASYLDLNDGPIQGGMLWGCSAGVNWYLTNNLKVQFDYQWNRRDQLPAGVNPGDITGFATRVQLNF
jgi:phosphate-selective porin OprO/OprP